MSRARAGVAVNSREVVAGSSSLFLKYDMILYVFI
jgi:hypothetical protein